MEVGYEEVGTADDRCIAFDIRIAGAADVPVTAAPATKYTPPPPCCEGWQGFYYGVYFGSGQGRTNETTTSTSTFQSREFLPPATVFTDFETENSAGSLTGKTTGSMVNLFAGYNWQLSPYWVVGGQLEGTVFSDI
jgi:hypothetical protein